MATEGKRSRSGDRTMDGHEVYIRIALMASAALLQDKTAHTVVLGPGDEAALRAIGRIDDASDSLRIKAMTNSDNWTREPGQGFAPHDPVPMALRIERGGKDGESQIIAD